MAKYRTKWKINGVPIRKYKTPKKIHTLAVTFTSRVELHDMPSKQSAIGWVNWSNRRRKQIRIRYEVRR